MAEMERARLQALQRVNALAIQDDDFRREGIENLASTLSRSGFALNPEEMDILIRFRNEAASWSDEELVKVLKKNKGEHRWRR